MDDMKEKFFDFLCFTKSKKKKKKKKKKTLLTTYCAYCNLTVWLGRH